MRKNQILLQPSKCYSIYGNIPLSIIDICFRFYYQGSGENKIVFKYVLLGQHSVGKTSIFKRFTTNSFSEYQETTIGAAYIEKSIIIDIYTIVCQMWDTSGQEKYRSLAPMYYRGAAIAIVVFDITDETTFQSAKEWMRELKHQEGDHVIVGLVANKCDLMDECRVNMDEVKEFASSKENIFLFETSAKTGQGVMNVFEQTGETDMIPLCVF